MEIESCKKKKEERSTNLLMNLSENSPSIYMPFVTILQKGCGQT